MQPSDAIELAASGSCPVTINVPSANQSVGHYIQISVTQSCANTTRTMIAYIDNKRCDDSSQGYPYPNPGCKTTGGAQNFSPSTWVEVAPGTHRIVVNSWDANGVSSVSSSVTFSYTPPVIAGTGDISCNGADRLTKPCQDSATASVLASVNPNLVFTLGDNQYENGELSNYNQYYAESWGITSLLGKTRPVVGNHEYNLPTANATFAQANAYMQANYFTYFTNQLTPLDSTKSGWYSFNVNTPSQGQPWHVVVLNAAICDTAVYGSQTWASTTYCDANSVQYGWLIQDLATFKADFPSAKCILAMWHEPRFNSGSHHSNCAYQDFWQALYDAHAEIVLNGHEHFYEHFGPQAPSGTCSAVSDAAHGIEQFTVGTGGRDTVGCGTRQPNSEVCVGTTVSPGGPYGILKLTLHDGSADYAYVNAGVPGALTVSDSGTILCHD